MNEANPCREIRRRADLRFCQPAALIPQRFAETPYSENHSSRIKNMTFYLDSN